MTSRIYLPFGFSLPFPQIIHNYVNQKLRTECHCACANKQKGDTDAQGTERPETASGRDRLCCTRSADSDRENRGNKTGTTSEAQERLGGRKSALRVIDGGGTQRRGQEGRCGSVGMMLTQPRWKLAESRADGLTAEYSLPPIPVYEIAESNGVNVVFADFGTNAEAVSGFCDFQEQRLYVNKDDATQRQSFTIAHELGHWLLHRDFFQADPDRYMVLPRFSDPNKNDPMEKEANKFAACLLVPERLLQPVKGASVSALANAFGVSRTMMEFRVKNAR